MEYTQFLNLTLPELLEYYDVNVFNTNYSKIDTKLQAHNTSLENINTNMAGQTPNKAEVIPQFTDLNSLTDGIYKSVNYSTAGYANMPEGIEEDFILISINSLQLIFAKAAIYSRSRINLTRYSAWEKLVNSKELNKKVDKVEGKSLTDQNYTLEEKNKLRDIEENATNYQHPSTHPASIIVETANKRFVTDAEKTKWNNKVDSVPGKSLTDQNYTLEEKNKLRDIEAQANKYVHPATHPANIIETDANRRFITDTERINWNGKADKTAVNTANTELAKQVAIVENVVIPIKDWAEDTNTGLYKANVENTAITANSSVDVNFSLSCLENAMEAEIRGVTESSLGSVAIYAVEIPETELTATLVIHKGVNINEV